MLLACSLTALGAGIGIERVQRDLQARFSFVTGGGYIQWPKCRANETPAPAFPKDGFYGDLSRDPEEAAYLVKYIAYCFYYDFVIYIDFVKAPGGETDLDGATEIVNYSPFDMEVADFITPDNYMEKLAILSAQINKLNLIQVGATQVIDGTSDYKSSYGHSQNGNCSDQLSCLATEHTAAPWGSLETSTYEECVLDDICTGGSSDRILQFSETSGGAGGTQVLFGNVRGKIRADLTGYKGGTAKTYLKLDLPSSRVLRGCRLPTPVAYWTFDEQSGVRVDSVGGLVMADSTRDHGSAPGQIGQAVQFQPTTDQNASFDTHVGEQHQQLSELRHHGDGFELLFWIKFSGFGLSGIDYTLYDANDRYIEDLFFYILPNGTAGLDLDNGTDDVPPDVYAGFTLSADRWYFVRVFYDKTEGRSGFQINDGTVQTGVPWPIPQSAKGGIAILYGQNTEFLVDELSFWEGSLPVGYLSQLYAGGVGSRALPADCQFGGDKPTATTAGKYGRWAQGDLPLETVATSGYVTGSEETGPITGSCPTGGVEANGWELYDQVVIVQPDFTTAPDPQDCCACSDCEPGSLNVGMDTAQIHFDVSLGSDNFGGSAGSLSLSAIEPTPSLATPSALRLSVADSVFQTGGGQFLTSQALLDIHVNNNYKYTISTYCAANAGAYSQGFYQPTGPPASTIVIENPDASPTVYNRLRITSTKDGTSTVSDYVYTSDSHQWELVTGGSSRRESRVSVWDQTHTTRTETITIKNRNNDVIYQEQNTYRRFPWGQERIAQVLDSDGAALTSNWTFYSDPVNDGGNYGRLKQEVDSMGHWVRYEYDSNGQESKRVTQFLNSAAGSAESVNRVVTTAYATTDPQITIEERLLGQLIGRRYQVAHSGEVRDIVGRAASTTWDDVGNLVTITKKFTTGDFIGQLQSIRNPDGTMQIYSYAYNANTTQRTETIDSGQPNQNCTAIVDGTRTVTIKGSGGQMITRTVTGIASAIVLANETYSNFDEFNRPRRVTYLDGTYSDTYYGCCGISSSVDRDGVETQYLYDELKRQRGTIEIRGNARITTTNLLDALGHVLRTDRQGDDGVHITQITLQSSSFDKAGRLTSQNNVLDGVTRYDYSSGPTVKTTIRTNGSTRIETVFQDGQLASIVGSAVPAVAYDYGVDGDGAFRKEFKGSSTSATEWTKYSSDFLGRPYKTSYPDSAASVSVFNSFGQLVRQIDPDGVSTVFEYNMRGELEYTVVDMNRNGQKDLTTSAGADDRITQTHRSVNHDLYGVDVNLTETYAWTTDDNGTAAYLVSRNAVSSDGLRTWQTARSGTTEATTQTQTVYPASPGLEKTVTQTNPDGTKAMRVYRYGRLLSVTSLDSTGAQVGKTAYDYDEHGRISKVTDARNGTTTYQYNNTDQIRVVTAPSLGNGEAAQTTTTYYNNMGWAFRIVYPDGGSVTNIFTLRGEIAQTSGSRTYPVGYVYDSQGRLLTLTTWSAYPYSGQRITRWNYNPLRGWLDNKLYPDPISGLPTRPGPSYLYWPSGRLYQRTWARGGVTTYTYNNAGESETVTYSDGTPGTTITYDRRGRQSTVTRNGTTTTFGFNDANEPTQESYSGGTLDGLNLSLGYDNYLRRGSLTLNSQPAALNYSYGYDQAGRLQTVSDGPSPASANSATYFYVANSPLIDHIQFKNGANLRMTTSKQYDRLNRLLQISSARNPGSAPGPAAFTFNYTYNSANQRVRLDMPDGGYWIYIYDKLGQVISAKRYWSDGTPVAGQQFEYAFDDIGNRTSTQAGGDETGANLRSASYSANYLNQYTSRTIPGAVDVIGSANVNATVTVNGQAPYRRGEYYQKALTADNFDTPVYQPVTVTASLSGFADTSQPASPPGHVFVPQNPENFGYDLDGNLQNDGRWTYTWDAENRLVRMVANTLVGPQQRIDFDYDWRGRRIRKRVWNNTAGSGNPTLDRRFIYDGWNLMAILDGGNNLIQSFLWGLDLSGTMQAAGGVGGLISVHDYQSGTAGTYFYAFDGNGNVVGLVGAADGTIAAQYEIDAFGNILRTTGLMGKANPFRFSAKPYDEDSGLILYAARPYHPRLGRWLSRDPAGEAAGANPYAAFENEPVGSVDLLGLWTIRRDRSQNWADALPDGPNDTVKSLAILLRLEESEAVKWLITPDGKPFDGKTLQCGTYKVPNTVAIYTSRPGYNPKTPDGLLTFVAFLRRSAVRLGRNYEAAGFHVDWNLEQASDEKFVSLWTSPGIYAMAFAGHAGENGFIATPASDTAVTPDQVAPPYKLSKIASLGCYTAGPYLIGYGPGGAPSFVRWRDFVSKLGTFVGYDGAAGWLNGGYLIDVE